MRNFKRRTDSEINKIRVYLLTGKSTGDKIHIVVQNYPLLIIKTILLHIRPEIFSNIKKENHVEAVAFRFI